MKLIYLGGGFVGASSAAVMAKFGHDILVYDISAERIKVFNTFDRDAIEANLFEQDLGSIIAQNKERMTFTDDYALVEKSLGDADAVFICVPTPVDEASGSHNLTYFNDAVGKLATALKNRNGGKQSQYVVVVNKSTVPIDMAQAVEEKLTAAGVVNFGVVSNPEFLVEGQAVKDSFSPDRVVVGATKPQDFAVLREIYQRFYYAPGVNYIEVNPREAAAGKLLANYILLSRLTTTFDVVGRVSESFADVSFEHLRKIVASDKRIGPYGFYNNIYAGGSCLTKDTAALAHQLKAAGGNAQQVEQTMAANLYQRDYFYKRLSQAVNISGQTFAVLGLAFKRDTNDVRNSGAVEIVLRLLSDGAAQVRVYDPAAMDLFKQLYGAKYEDRIVYAKNEQDAVQGSRVCLILTDWPQFSTVDKTITKICPPPYLVADGRRMLAHAYDALQGAGYEILAVGSPFKK